MKEIVKNQFNIHLLVEMVLRVDKIFIMCSFAFLVGYLFFNVKLHYVREKQFLRNVDDGKKRRSSIELSNNISERRCELKASEPVSERSERASGYILGVATGLSASES